MEGGSMSIPSRESSYRHALTDKGQSQGQGQGQSQVQMYDDNDQGNVWGNAFMPMPFSSILRGHLVARSGLIFQQYAQMNKEDVRHLEGGAGGGGGEGISNSSSGGGSSRGNSSGSSGDEGEEVALGLRGVSLDYLRAHHGSLVHAMALPNPLKQVLLGYASTPTDNTYSSSGSSSSGSGGSSSGGVNSGSSGSKDAKSSSSGNDDHRHHSNSDQEGYSESKKNDSCHQVTPSPRSRTEIPQWGYLSFKEACDALEQNTRSAQQAIGGSGGGNGSYVGPGLGYSFPPEGSYGSPYDHHNKYAPEYAHPVKPPPPPPSPHTYIYIIYPDKAPTFPRFIPLLKTFHPTLHSYSCQPSNAPHPSIHSSTRHYTTLLPPVPVKNPVCC